MSTTILVLSDSHDYTENMIKAVRRFKPDIMVFLGDGIYDFEQLKKQFPEIRSYSVRGNNDPFGSAFRECRFTVEGIRVFMTHGDKYIVRSSWVSDLRQAALSIRPETDLLLFGHTHEPFDENYFTIRFFNPGTCGNADYATCGLITVDGKAISTRTENLGTN